MMNLKKIEGTWFLIHDGELIESFDSKEEALNSSYGRACGLAEFDKARKWESLYDAENAGYWRYRR